MRHYSQFKPVVVESSRHDSHIYTLRGAAGACLNWSKEINEALHMFGREVEVMFASHSWPRWATPASRCCARSATPTEPQQPDAALVNQA